MTDLQAATFYAESSHLNTCCRHCRLLVHASKGCRHQKHLLRIYRVQSVARYTDCNSHTGQHWRAAQDCLNSITLLIQRTPVYKDSLKSRDCSYAKPCTIDGWKLKCKLAVFARGNIVFGSKQRNRRNKHFFLPYYNAYNSHWLKKKKKILAGKY